MAVVLAMVASIWLWLGIIPQLMFGSRRRRAAALLGEWLTGPIGLAMAFGQRDDRRRR